MTSEHDIQRVLDRWFTERPTEVSERVLEEVAGRISRQRQRPALRLPWMDVEMNPIFKVGAAVAAVVLIAVIGYNLLPGQEGVAGPAPTATPSPTPSPTPVVEAMPEEGILPAGTYRASPFTSVPLNVTFTVPEGWRAFQNWAILGPNGTEAPGGIGVGFLKVDGVFRDPCHWDVDGSGSFTQPGDVSVGPSVDDLVAALQANESYTTSDPVPVSVGSYAGRRIDVHVPTNLDVADLAACDRGPEDASGLYYVFTGATGEGGLFAQGPGQVFHDWILDVDGARVIVGYNDYETTPDADRAAAEAIIDSMVFEP